MTCLAPTSGKPGLSTSYDFVHRHDRYPLSGDLDRRSRQAVWTGRGGKTQRNLRLETAVAKGHCSSSLAVVDSAP